MRMVLVRKQGGAYSRYSLRAVIYKYSLKVVFMKYSLHCVFRFLQSRLCIP